jgi:oligopeptide/dipeptide ABC transporter ATP-binding protein
MTTADILLSVEGVKRYYPMRSRGVTTFVKAVDGVDFAVHSGETLGLVGESGCGKSTLGRLILRLEPPTAGTIRFSGVDLTVLSKKELKAFRREVQIVFQDPYSSLNPRKKIRNIVGEAFRIHRLYDTSERENRIRELLQVVGLRPEYADRYPHEFSGGQRQRICIARALALNPRLVIADEPVSALDVSIQAQILNLMVSLQERFGLTYLFISHDLSVVRHVSDRVIVMYLGRLVESAPTRVLFQSPRHPYSEALISAVPTANPRKKQSRIPLAGDVPSPIDPPPGCPFHPRCRYREPKCTEVLPLPVEIEPGRMTACHYPLHKEGGSHA